MTPIPLTCVLADDHPAVVASLIAFLPRCGIDVLAEARTGDEALRKIEEHHPDLALLDLRMPGPGGAEVIRRLERVSPETAAVVYTAYVDAPVLEELLDAGARAIVLKDAPLPDLVRALEIVAGGGLYLDAGLTGALTARRDEAPEVTRREREVLRLLSDGMTNEEIGRELFISPETVRTHVRRVIAKLGAKTRTQAVAAALRRRLIA